MENPTRGKSRSFKKRKVCTLAKLDLSTKGGRNRKSKQPEVDIDRCDKGNLISLIAPVNVLHIKGDWFSYYGIVKPSSVLEIGSAFKLGKRKKKLKKIMIRLIMNGIVFWSQREITHLDTMTRVYDVWREIRVDGRIKVDRIGAQNLWKQVCWKQREEQFVRTFDRSPAITAASHWLTSHRLLLRSREYFHSEV